MNLFSKKVYITCALSVFCYMGRAQVVIDCDSALNQTINCCEVPQQTNNCVTTAQYLPKNITMRQCLWGIGQGSLLDSYLSPLTYSGTDFSLLYRTERPAHWGKEKVSVKSHYNIHTCYAKSPTDDGKAFDMELSALGGWHYNWLFAAWRIALGGLFEGSGGFTYNTRNGNNPVQARLGASFLASTIVSYQFNFFKRKATASLEMNAQIMGVQFSPTYGQSYYEIFSLGHTNGIIHFTHPANCPTEQLLATLTLPIKHANITMGYMADIRQSKLGGLKRHAWRNSFMIGYTRQFKRL